jgi:hypothetical protein
MLANIERRRVNQIADCKPKIAIYLAIPNHVQRVAGKVPFVRHALRYQLDPGGAIRVAGHIDDADTPRSPLSRLIRGYLSRSAIGQMLRTPRVSADDVRLLLATVQRSRNLLTTDYPGIKFQVILWPSLREDGKVYGALQDGFRELHIPVHRVEDILPGFNSDSAKYVLSKRDLHPNGTANRLLAEYVLTKIVERP